MTYIEEAKTLTIQYLQRSPERMERLGTIRLYLQRNGSSTLISKVNNVGWPNEFKQLLKQSWNGIFSVQGRNVFLNDGLALQCLAFTQNKVSNKRGERNANGKQINWCQTSDNAKSLPLSKRCAHANAICKRRWPTNVCQSLKRINWTWEAAWHSM